VRRRAAVGLLGAALLLACGCEEEPFLSSAAGHDFGRNDPSLYAAMGDSITQGYGDGGAPYPSRLEALLGRTVLNFAQGGTRAADGLALVDRVAASRPGFVLVCYGANDAIHGGSPADVKETLRALVATLRDSQCLVLIANLLPMTGSHSAFAGNARAISEAIGELADEDAIPLVDLAAAFGPGDGLLQGDGLHPNDAGTQLIAQTFYDMLRSSVH
jgi:lysophospholipase L1-like esterase